MAVYIAIVKFVLRVDMSKLKAIDPEMVGKSRCRCLR